MFRGYRGDFHSPGRECWLFIGWQTLRNVLEIRDRLHGHPACVNGLFTKHGPLQRMLMRCQDDATPVRCGPRWGDTNNDPDLEMRAGGGPCPCRRTPRRWLIVCQCAGVRTVGPKKAKVLFLGRARRLRDGLGGRPLSKSSSFWFLGPMKGKWRVMKSYGDRFQKQPITPTTARFPGYIGVHPSNHSHCHAAGRCRHQAFYSHSGSCRMNELNLLPGSDHAAGERLRDHKHIMTGSLMRLMTGLTSRHK